MSGLSVQASSVPTTEIEYEMSDEVISSVLFENRAQASLPGSLGCKPTTSTICWSSQKITEYYLYKPSFITQVGIVGFASILSAKAKTLPRTTAINMGEFALLALKDVKVKQVSTFGRNKTTTYEKRESYFYVGESYWTKATSMYYYNSNYNSY